MVRAQRLLPALLMISLVAPAAIAGHTHGSTPSTWKLNLQESDFGGGPALKSDEIHLLTDTEKWLHYTEVSTDDQGKTSKLSWSGPQDGSMRPVVGMSGAKAGYKTEEDSSQFVMADGTEFDTVMTMSNDKKKVTEKVTVKDKAGHEFHQTLVYDRTK